MASTTVVDRDAEAEPLVVERVPATDFREPPAVSAAEPPAPPAATPATAPATTPPAPAPAAPPASLPPDLADQIYTKIERRLRMELLLEQERKGSLNAWRSR